MKKDASTPNLNTNTQTKKPTNRDVARLAGVSVATVSYVINGKATEKISEATKKKVFQAMNILNYTPNPYAVGLNTEQARNIMVRTSEHISHMSETELLFFMRSFNAFCEENGYQLIYSMSKKATQVAANACICFDLSDEEFHAFASENYIPVIAIDSLINDPVFYQITTNYDRVNECAKQYFNNADFTYIAILPQNKNIKEKILSVFKSVIFVSSVSDLKNIKCGNGNIALTQQSLFEAVSIIDGINIYLYNEYIEKRNPIVLDCIIRALDRLNTPDTDHFISF